MVCLRPREISATLGVLWVDRRQDLYRVICGDLIIVSMRGFQGICVKYLSMRTLSNQHYRYQSEVRITNVLTFH